MDDMEDTVLLIDDDADVRDAVARLFRSAGWNTEVFASGQEFLARSNFTGAGCVVLDINMPGISGPQVHDKMREQAMTLPVIYLSAHCDVPVSVQAMKHGALDVLQKPVDSDVLLTAVADAVKWHRLEVARRACNQVIAQRLATLSVREREVLDHVVLGRLNKQIAADMRIAEKTVKVHRGRAMAKMQVRSVAALVHACEQLAAKPH